jgi:hypothetical protein
MCVGVFGGGFARMMWLEDRLGPDSDAVPGAWDTPTLAGGLMVVLIAVSAVGAAGIVVSAVKLVRRHGANPVGGGSGGWFALGVVSLAVLVGGAFMSAGLFIGDFIQVMWLEDQFGADSDVMNMSMETPQVTAILMVGLVVVAAVGAAGVAVSAVKLARRGADSASRARVVLPLVLMGVGVLSGLLTPVLGVPLVGVGAIWAAASVFSRRYGGPSVAPLARSHNPA